MEEFGWNTAQWGIILSAFFVGYAILQIPAGWLSDKYGGVKTLAFGTGWWSLFTIATAWARTIPTMAVVRALLGAGEAVNFPSHTAVTSRWIPVQERGRAQALNLSGMAFGTAFTIPVVAWIVKSFGWRWAFYSFGVVGFIWCIIWLWYVKDDPRQHPGVSPEELDYIRAGEREERLTNIDWNRILRSGPVWGLTVNYFFQNYCWYLYLTWLPGYLVMARHFDLMKTGIYAMLPYIGSFIAMNFGGWVCDKLAPVVGLTKSRKYVMYSAFAGCAVFLYFAARAQSPYTAVILITLSVFFLSLNYAPFWALPIDLGPRSAGVISGIMNTSGTLAGIIAPGLTGWIVQASGSWVYALTVAVVMALLGIIVCAVGVSAERVTD